MDLQELTKVRSTNVDSIKHGSLWNIKLRHNFVTPNNFNQAFTLSQTSYSILLAFFTESAKTRIEKSKCRKIWIPFYKESFSNRILLSKETICHLTWYMTSPTVAFSIMVSETPFVAKIGVYSLTLLIETKITLQVVKVVEVPLSVADML